MTVLRCIKLPVNWTRCAVLETVLVSVWEPGCGVVRRMYIVNGYNSTSVLCLVNLLVDIYEMINIEVVGTLKIHSWSSGFVHSVE